MTKFKTSFSQLLASGSRSCARCGSRFSTFGREYICAACRKPRVAARKTEDRQELSNREQQIVDLICCAKTNKEIAYELCLTEGTVKEYLHHIFRKLRVTNRTELALSRLNASLLRPAHREMKQLTELPS
jgi:DNA-binding NarL/FixJ family response regulator